MTTPNAIFLIGLIFMAVSLMVAGYMFRRAALSFGATGAWLIIAGLMYTISTGPWDIFYGLFWVSAGMSLVAGLEGMVVKPLPSQMEPEEKDEDDVEGQWDDWSARRGRYQQRIGRRKAGSSRGRRQAQRESEFSRSGKL